MVTRFSDGTTCEYCGNLILTALGLDYKEMGKVYCCKECADDDKEKMKKAK